MGSIQEYGKLFERLDLTELSVEEDGLKLTLKRNVSAAQGSVMPAAIKTSGSDAAVSAAQTSEEVNGEEIKAPILGVFYANEVPVKEGDVVKKGDVLCSIEAMKMMNEVRSTADGTVLKVSAENGGLVEYHQTLFVIG